MVSDSPRSRVRFKLGFGTLIIVPLQVALIALLGRCFYLQVLRGDYYRQRRHRVVTASEVEIGQRGRIISADGVTLARDEPIWRVALDPIHASRYAAPRPGELESRRARLQFALDEFWESFPCATGSDHGVLRARVEELREQNRQFCWIGTLTDVQQYQRFTAWRHARAWRRCFRAEPRSGRVYPQGDLAAQLLGEYGTTDYYYGLERALEQDLRSVDGECQLDLDAIHRPSYRERDDGVPPVHGNDVELTIQTRVQRLLEREVEAVRLQHSARMTLAAVIDPHTGAILGAASSPTSMSPPDERELSGQLTARQILERTCLQLTTFTYEPGSIIKPLHLAIAFEAGIDPHRRLKPRPGTSYTMRDGRHRRTFRDVSSRGPLDVEGTIIHSSNIGMAHLGFLIGRQGLARSLRAARLGELTGIEIPQQRGVTPLDPNRRWDWYTTGSISFGYELLVTPIQMLRAYSSLINGGSAVEPHLVRRVADRVRRTDGGERIYDEDISRRVRLLLRRAVVEGTSLARYGADAIRLAGKSGTAEKTGTKAHRSSYIGFAPVENPRYMMMMVVDEPKGRVFGAGASGPSVTRVLCALLSPRTPEPSDLGGSFEREGELPLGVSPAGESPARRRPPSIGGTSKPWNPARTR